MPSQASRRHPALLDGDHAARADAQPPTIAGRVAQFEQLGAALSAAERVTVVGGGGTGIELACETRATQRAWQT